MIDGQNLGKQAAGGDGSMPKESRTGNVILDAIADKLEKEKAERMADYKKAVQSINDMRDASQAQTLQDLQDSAAKSRQEAQERMAKFDQVKFDYENEKHFIENIGTAASMANLTAADLPSDFTGSPEQAKIFLVAYVKNLIGMNTFSGEAMYNGITPDQNAAQLAMPNETALALFTLLKDQWKGKTSLTLEMTKVMLLARIRNLKYGTAAATTFRDKFNPNHIASGGDTVNHLNDVLVVTVDPESRKKMILLARDAYIKDMAERQAAQQSSMVTKIS